MPGAQYRGGIRTYVQPSGRAGYHPPRYEALTVRSLPAVRTARSRSDPSTTLPDELSRILGITNRIETVGFCMVLVETVLGGAGFVPLLLGGDLIGLAVLFLVLAVVAAVVGASGVAGLSMDIAKWLIIIFVVLAIISFVL